MKLSPSQAEIEEVQSAHRERIVGSWHLEPGSRVLEIGCGQGDMTVVLARAVGSEGRVVAVDLASPDYGAPLTLGESAAIVKASPVGDQIDFRFQFDVLDTSNTFDADAFDYVVLAHSSWYFGSLDQLGRTLERVRPWANTLCFAEWDLQPRSFSQLPHLLAVLIQGQVEAFKKESSANVRTPIARTRLKQLLKESGWIQVAESLVDSPDMQDADWEVSASLSTSLWDVQGADLPAKFVALIESQIDVLKEIAAPRGNAPLSAYSIRAERSGQ